MVARVEHIPQADASVHHRLQLHDTFVPQLMAALADEAWWPASSFYRSCIRLAALPEVRWPARLP